MSDVPDLNLIAHQQRRILDEVASLREDMPVLTSVVMRQDATSTTLLNEIRALHSQHGRFGNRLRALEDKLTPN